MSRLNLEREAAKITEELGEVVFIGAVAVNHFARFRATKDIDLVMASSLNETKLRQLGYIPRQGSKTSWYTPRGIRADFYTKDVGGIAVGWILRNLVSVRVGVRSISVICLEGLILAKHRAGRTQDIADLQELMKHNGQSIRWNVMAQIGTGLEIAELRKVAIAFR